MSTEKYMSHLMPTYNEPPVTFVRGSGSRLWDENGKEYLDFLSGLAVTSLGHAHPAVANAISEQARSLVHVSNLYGSTPGPKLAATIDRLLGGGGKVFFSNSGAEANECAIKLARKWAGPVVGGRGRFAVVSAYGSFHGRTLAALAATGQPGKQEAFQPMPEGFRHVAWNDSVALAAAIDDSIAAVLVEPVQGEGGVNPADAGYFAAIRQICDERGLLMIVDEVQTGFGRTGRWFGFEHFGVRPDVVTLAKALGNGVPIGACWARSEVAKSFKPGDHGSTYGGQPLAAAAAQATLDVMEAQDVPARAEAAGAVLRTGLAGLPGVVSVRGLGLLLAAELREGLDARMVAAAALDEGLVVNPVTGSSLRLAPSLLVERDEIFEALSRLRVALERSGAAEPDS